MNVIQSFEKNTAEYLKNLNIPLKDKKILVALSGGADSVSLLMVLCALGSKMGFSVFALHVNHGIRGDEALHDEEFCAELCRQIGIHLKCCHADIPALAANRKQSLETCGREYRYGVMEEYCKEKGIDYIATAHNANDNAETVLYNLLRGSGSEGLCGIPKLRGNIIRPLLSTSRESIEAYLSALGQGYVTDCTNSDNCYTRNYIRNVLIPACKTVNSDVLAAINRASFAVAEDCAYINGAVENLNSVSDLRSLPSALQSRVIKNEYKRLFGGSLEGVHISAIKNALRSTETKYISLPDEVNAVVCRGKLSFETDKEKAVLEETLLAEGETFAAGGRVHIFVGTDLKNGVRIKRDAICGKLYIRARRSGDKVLVRKINRSVKKSFIDNKIPAAIREIVPVVCDDKGIIYVPYVGVADRAYPKKSDEFFTVCVTIDERFGLLKDEEK